MNNCSRCGKGGLLARIDKETGLCSSCIKADRTIYEHFLSLGRKAAFFRNGVLYDFIPRTGSQSLYDDNGLTYHKDTIIVSDGDIYDPEDPNTIINLRIPKFNSLKGSMPSVTIDLSYILKMRCGQLDNADHIDTFLQTTLYMMDASPIGWLRGDYLQVIQTFYQFGLFREGDYYESNYRINNPSLFSSPFDESQEGKHLIGKYYNETKWRQHHEYEELKRLIPDITPDTYKGYAQIRGRKTKRYVELVKQAELLGYIFSNNLDHHYCRKKNSFVKMEMKYDTSGKSPQLIYCECPYHANGRCDGRNEFDLLCIYPETGNKKVEFYIGNDPSSQLSMVLNFALKNRIITAKMLNEKTGLSIGAAEICLKQLTRMGVLKTWEYSSQYYIAIMTSEAVKRYGHVTDELL